MGPACAGPLARSTTAMTPLRKRMIDDMVSAGLAPNTQAAYIRGVHGLAAHYRRSPGDLGETEVRSYFLHLRDERGVAQGTFRPYMLASSFSTHARSTASEPSDDATAQSPASGSTEEARICPNCKAGRLVEIGRIYPEQASGP